MRTEIIHNFAHSPNLSVISPTSQLILQPFRRFTYATAHFPTLPLLHLCHSSFSNPSFASPMPQALHLIHLASRPCRIQRSRDLWSVPMGHSSKIPGGYHSDHPKSSYQVSVFFILDRKTGMVTVMAAQNFLGVALRDAP